MTKPGPTTASPDDRVQQPQDWEKVISVAYLRLTGSTQVEAAEAVGVGERTVVDWEACSWWAEATMVASSRWLSGMDAKVRAALSRSLGDADQYATTARWWAERRIGDLAPPRQRTEHSGQVAIADAREMTEAELLAIAAGGK